MNFIYELYTLLQINFLTFISKAGSYLIIGFITSSILSLLLAYSTTFLVKLWNKKYKLKKSDYFFVTLATLIAFVSFLSLFGFKYYNNSKSKLFSRVWYNELVANQSWQHQFSQETDTDLNEVDKLLSYTKASIDFLKKKSPILMADFSKDLVKNHHVQLAINSINNKNKYYNYNSFLPKDSPKVISFMLEQNIQKEGSYSKFISISILLFVLFAAILFFLCLSPLFYSAYKDLKLYI